MFVAALAVAGLLVGSVLTMVIDRVPDRQPLWGSGPRCPYCEATIAGRDLVPVLSWLALRGRCRACAHRITPAYPLVELATAGLYAAAAVEFGASWVLVPHLVLIAALVAISVVDLYLYIIPNRILFPALGVSIVLIAVVSVVEGFGSLVFRALAGAVVYFLFLFVPHLVSPRGMGFGDVKLALLLGLFLGWPYADVTSGVLLIMYTLIIAAVIGVIGGLTLAVARRVLARDVLPDPELVPRGAAEGAEAAGEAAPVDVSTVPILSHSFPFGPALAAATLIGVFFSEQLLP